MKHRILITTLASVMLIGGISTASTVISNTQTVQAATPSFHSSYWTKNRRVYVTKKITFKRYDALKGRIVRGHRTFKAGQRITVRNAGEFDGWVLAGTKAGSRYWWVSTSASTKWLSLTKPVRTRAYLKNSTYQDSHGIKATFGEATNVKTKDGQSLVMLTANVTNNGSHVITPTDWIEELGFLSVNPNKTRVKSSDILTDYPDFDELPSNKWSDLVATGEKKLSSGDSAQIAIALKANKSISTLYITSLNLTKSKMPVVTLRTTTGALN